ncbi:MAG TPA: metal-dependent hydrolase [Archangium sp.]|nr:metal-dependent hydrolase [Archangium sp.]
MRNKLMAVTVGALLGLSGTAAAQPPAGKGPAKKEAAAATAGKTELTWWGHAAFVIRTPGGATLAIDPWFSNPKAPQGAQWPEQVDAILVSHGHFDHVGETKALQQKTGAQVFGCYELVSLLGVPQDKAMGGNVGGTFKVKDATIHFVEAVHSSSYAADEKSPAQYAGAPMGFVIQIDNGPTLYHGGDTGLFGGMSQIGERFKPTYALLPIGGHFTLDPTGAAQAARLLGNPTVVPMHYGTFPLLAGTPDKLEADLKKAKSNAKVKALEVGKATAL